MVIVFCIQVTYNGKCVLHSGSLSHKYPSAYPQASTGYDQYSQPQPNLYNPAAQQPAGYPG